MHAPLARLQHAPSTGCGHRFGEQFPPPAHTLGTMHAACAVTEQFPVLGTQHAPCGGCGQVFTGVQLPPTLQLVPTPQLVWIPNEHAPVCALQHVPIGGCGHGFGEHVVGPSVHTVPPAAHWNCALIAHSPLSVTQQLPTGGTKHTLGVHPPPLVHTLGTKQLAWIVVVHAPSCVQQLPLAGSGHTAVEHTTSCVHTLGAAHCTMKLLEHVPSPRLQHAPIGGTTHGLGSHTPSCVQLAPPAHAPCVPMLHVPVSEQHDPLVTHGFGGPHVRPAVQKFVIAHDAWKYTTHPPAVVQHVPVCGQGLAVHTAFTMNRFGNGHCADAVTAVLGPPVMQHAPDFARANPPGHAAPRTITTQQHSTRV